MNKKQIFKRFWFSLGGRKNRMLFCERKKATQVAFSSGYYQLYVVIEITILNLEKIFNITIKFMKNYYWSVAFSIMIS